MAILHSNYRMNNDEHGLSIVNKKFDLVFVLFSNMYAKQETIQTISHYKFYSFLLILRKVVNEIIEIIIYTNICTYIGIYIIK